MKRKVNPNELGDDQRETPFAVKLSAGATAIGVALGLAGCYPSGANANPETTPTPEPSATAPVTPGPSETTVPTATETPSPVESPTPSAEVNPFDDAEFRRLDSLSLEDFLLLEPREAREHYGSYFSFKYSDDSWRMNYGINTPMKDYNPFIRPATPDDSNEAIAFFVLNRIYSSGAAEAADADPKDYDREKDKDAGRKLLAALLPDQQPDRYSDIYMLLMKNYNKGPGSGEYFDSLGSIEVNSDIRDLGPIEDLDGTQYEQAREVVVKVTPVQFSDGTGGIPWSMTLRMGFVPGDETHPAQWRVMERLTLAYGQF